VSRYVRYGDFAALRETLLSRIEKLEARLEGLRKEVLELRMRLEEGGNGKA